MYDGEKLKAASNAILDRIILVASGAQPTAVKDLAEAFNLLASATRSKS